ncbi:contact-dependent growth inhibition system immunity protein [Catalinimonas sp. 4WD22]|uniref:contact-dependent growth inhibition system immunity protein n=1 Tax=Catalinimonas locisalis TaxID=3133978 RepID=UPI00310182A0
MRTKSIEELENDYWKDLKEFPTGLVKRCYEYRKIPLRQLTTEQIRTLISQQIGLKFLIGMAMEKLGQNVLEEGDLYKGDLLETVSKVPSELWDKHPTERQILNEIINANSSLIRDELGEKEFDRIKARID